MLCRLVRPTLDPSLLMRDDRYARGIDELIWLDDGMVEEKVWRAYKLRA